MSMSNAFEIALLGLILNGTAIPGLADNAASSPLTSLYLSLHTADPGEAGTQTTSEVTYTGYARKAVTRNAAGWTVSSSDGSATLTSLQSFTAGTGGSGSGAFWAIGTAATGAGMILFSGPVSPAIATGNGVTPQLGTGTTITLD